MDLRALIAGLAAAFPRDGVGAETVAVYERALADLPADELEFVVARHIRVGRRFPTVAEMVGEVFERRLGLPEPDQAWERVQRLAFARAEYDTCPRCGGGGEEPTLGAEVSASPGWPEARPCRECGGNGEVEVARRELRAALTEPEREALEVVGGARGIGEAEILGVARSQFLKAYEARRRRALERANLRSAVSPASGRALEPPPEAAGAA